MAAKTRTYTQYRDAIRTVDSLLALEGTPASHRAAFGKLKTEFEANGKEWMKAATAKAPAPKAKKAKPANA
jgi:hypothetical protein